MGYKHYKIQLASVLNGANNTAAGGSVYVAAASDTTKVPLFTAAGAVASNPVALVNGLIEFWTLDTVASVDLYGQTPRGHGFTQKGVVASGNNEIYVESNTRFTELVIPFSGADQTATVETNTGFTIPTNAVVQPYGGGLDVMTAQSAKTVSVGILSSETNGSATGFYVGLSLAATGPVIPAFTITTGVLAANTYGAFLSDYTVGTNADDRGISNRKEYPCDGVAHTVTYTTSSGTTTAKGFIKLPMILSNL